jgi:membrane-anchored protein YejM (alkaline phosphatase superfamily)
MALWDTYNLNQWEGKAGQPAKNLGKFTYKDMSTSDTEIQQTAVKWIQAHAKDQKPFFMYLNFMKVHQPNFPSPEWKGKSPAGMPYLDAVMELDDKRSAISASPRTRW